MASIRVDQSHCNYHLALSLVKDGWNVIFKDAGRVNRGGIGTQGSLLKIFEENSLPIPDIVAVRGSSIFIIEIDSTYSKVKKSIDRYLASNNLILKSINEAVPNIKLSSISLGYCKMGITTKASVPKSIEKLSQESVDKYIIFEEARKPTLYNLN